MINYKPPRIRIQLKIQTEHKNDNATYFLVVSNDDAYPPEQIPKESGELTQHKEQEMGELNSYANFLKKRLSADGFAGGHRQDDKYVGSRSNRSHKYVRRGDGRKTF